MGGFAALAASVLIPGGEGEAAEMAASAGRVVSEDVYAFGNSTAPRLPRTSDFGVADAQATIPSQANAEWPKGASTTTNPESSRLSGHYHKLPKGTRLPEGMKIKADSKEVGGTMTPGHHTLYNTQDIPFTDFQNLFKDLPWSKAGRKP